MAPSKKTTLKPLPKSVAHWFDPIAFALVIVITYLFFRTSSLTDTQMAVVMGLILTVYMCGLEWLRAPWRKTARPKTPMRDVLNSSIIKWLGTMAGFMLILIGWWFFEEYRRPSYAPIFEVIPYAMMIVPLVVAVCIFYTEWRLGVAKHHGEELGLIMLGRWREVEWPHLRDDLLSWLIKGFFFVINFCELERVLGVLRGNEDKIFILPWHQVQPFILVIIYSFIIAAILPGYLFSSRLFGTQIKAIDRSWFGHVVTFMCYSPFVGGVFNRTFNYHPYVTSPSWNTPWVKSFSDNEMMLYIIGGLIILSEIGHYLGEATLGIRSSNLTNRGIVTNGIFRLCKHPVWVTKCISWFLIWLPIVSGATYFESLRYTIAFICVCGIYMCRGWAEEKVLASDPDYVAYGLWMDKHSLFAFAGRLVPPLTFRWRMQRWIKQGDIDPSLLPR